jgi:hypothetical protein
MSLMHVRSTRHPRALLTLLTAALACATLPACSNPESAIGFDEPDPAARFRAIRRAQATHDRSAIPDLINLLHSDDPAERFFASAALKDLAGEDFHYDPTATRSDRDAAAARWAAWYAQGDLLAPDTRSMGTRRGQGRPESSASIREPTP